MNCKEEQENKTDSIQETIEAVYNTAIEAGYTEREAQHLSLTKLKCLQDYPIEEYEVDIDLRKQVLTDIVPELDLQPKEVQANILWDYGFDTRRHNWWKDVLAFRIGTDVCLGLFWVGQERTDKEWIKDKKRSSFHAQVKHKHDRELEKDLFRLSGGRMYG